MARSKSVASNDPSTGELVYSCAVDLMYERGFHGTSMRDVARSVGVQMSTLYHYFPSKQDLLMSIMTTAMEAMTDRVTEAIAEIDDPREQLKTAVHAHITFHADQLKEAVVADTELRSLEGDDLKSIIALRDRYEGIFRAIIDSGQRAGEFRPSDSKLTTRAILGAITDVGNWYRPRGRLALDAISTEYLDIFMSGINATTSAAAPVRRRSTTRR